MSRQKIAVLGTPVSSGNRGVLALAESLINLCAARADVTLLLSHRDNLPISSRVDGAYRLVAIVNCRLSPKSHLREHLAWIVLASLLYRLIPLGTVRQALSRNTPWIEAIEGAQYAGDIRGGDSFSDIYGLKRFLIGFLIAWTVVLVKGSIVQFPQTYGPYKTTVARWLARYLLRRSSVVIARDRESLRVAQEVAGNAKQVLLSPDVAFSLEAILPEKLTLDPPLPSHQSTAFELRAATPIGLSINGLMYNGGYTRNNMFGLKLDYAALLPKLIAALLQEHPGDLWLVPHVLQPPGNVESDPEACRQVRDSLPAELRGRVRIVATEYDCHELKAIIGLCDFFIGSRMHACIAALSQGIPCVGLAYSMKFRGVFETVGMEDWVVDGRTVTNDEAVERVVAHYRKRNDAREPLGAAAAGAKARLNEVFKSLLSGATPK